MTLAQQSEIEEGSQQGNGVQSRRQQHRRRHVGASTPPVTEEQGAEKESPGRRANVGAMERKVSAVAGAILALAGIKRRDTVGLLVAAVGGGLIYRGVSGKCAMYRAMGVSTAHEMSVEEEVEARRTHVAQSYLINRTPEELYAFWRNFENLAGIMSHLESVQVLDEKRSHWVTKAPSIAGGKVSWDAEITRDVPNERIEWRSLPGGDVDNVGSVEFAKAPGDRGTMVLVKLDYVAPAGAIGRWAAKLFGDAPETQIKEDLRNFKRKMETGEVPTTTGQPRGTCQGIGKREGE